MRLKPNSQEKTTKVIFGFVIAIVLLGFYVFLISRGVSIGMCVENDECTKYSSAAAFTDRMASSLAMIAGLVSALVISELAVTKKGEAPAARMISDTAGEGKIKLLKIATFVYVVVWITAGVYAFFVGYLGFKPDTLPAISDLGQSWLGIAVARLMGRATFRGLSPGLLSTTKAVTVRRC